VTVESTAGAMARRMRLAHLLREKARDSIIRSPASIAQSGVWFMQQMDPSSRAYHVAFSVRVMSPLDNAAVAAALQRLIDRHAMLRSTFHHTGEALEIETKGAAEPHLDTINASRWDDATLLHRVQDMFDQPFDLAAGPLFRTAVFTRRTDDHVLLLVLHHLICDGWSLFIVINEFLEYYEACFLGRAASLPPPGPEFRDLVQSQQEWLASEAAERCRAYWIARLSGHLPKLTFPTSSSGAHKAAAGHGRYDFDIDNDIRVGLARIARSCGVSLFGVLFAAYQVLLMALSGQKDIVVGVPMAGRRLPRSENVVGHFVNIVPLRCDLSGDPTFADVIARSWAELQKAADNQEFPFLEVVRALGPTYRSGQTPLIRTLFNFLNPPPGSPLADLPPFGTEPLAWGHLQLIPFQIDIVEEAHDLLCNVTQSRDRLHVCLQFSRAIFGPDDVAELSGRFNAIMRALATDPSCPVQHF
jgi:hypothetical protein